MIKRLFLTAAVGGAFLAACVLLEAPLKVWGGVVLGMAGGVMWSQLYD